MTDTHVELLNLTLSGEDVAWRSLDHFLREWGERPGTFVMRGIELAGLGPYTAAFFDPIDELEVFDSDDTKSRDGSQHALDVWGHIDAWQRGLPEGGGIVTGFFRYELLYAIEPGVSRPRSGETGPYARLPLVKFYRYREGYLFDDTAKHPTQRIVDTTVAKNFQPSNGGTHDRRPTPVSSQSLHLGAPTAREGESSYLAKVEAIRSLIREGEVYQVNLSNGYAFPFTGELRDLFLSTCMAQYGALSIVDSKQSIVSNSPELFLRREGSTIRCSPIKGTIARGGNEASDATERGRLASSVKDGAELAMIVDLMRNDLSKVCKTGTVKVENEHRIVSLPYVHHLVSDITGVLKDGASLRDILCALFPSGSITGAPKRAAMEYIARFEGEPRGIYTGGLGVFLGDSWTISVAIRTALLHDGMLYTHSGGGVTWRSDPAAEWREIESKLRWLNPE